MAITGVGQVDPNLFVTREDQMIARRFLEPVTASFPVQKQPVIISEAAKELAAKWAASMSHQTVPQTEKTDNTQQQVAKTK